ncbi:hypothetical protein PR048_000976 [Dryococelus australis]|uniref:Reverse transcriptase/retrotransposon-derived protein RNase H-like domain-containing protein n=1 Tax=Dryococelus australis TaxID=614101 RepID=A0ABQ9IG35_9NEOP|nr:hypothetical protein PR048_000976 [Dryococelus australis]
MRSTFLLDQEAVTVFEQLKSDVKASVVSSIDAKVTFSVETNASDFAVGATLSQNNRPAAFFSRSLSKSEHHHSSIEKEAYAIVEALRKWRHFLMGRQFRLVNGSTVHHICVQQRPQKHIPAIHTSQGSMSSRGDKNVSLGPEQESSLFARRKITSSCQVCAEVKPRFHKHEGNIIKATHPFERINMDFKGPLSSAARNRNPEHLYVRFPSGRETLVSTRYLAPVEGRMEEILSTDGQYPASLEFRSPHSAEWSLAFLESRRSSTCVREEVQEGLPNDQPSVELRYHVEVPLEHSARVHQPPTNLKDYFT